MGKKPPPKLSAEEKAAAAAAKATETLFKAAKNDERSKAEDALTKGAQVDFVNDVRGSWVGLYSSLLPQLTVCPTSVCSQKGHNAAHVAAAFGALEVLRLLYSKDIELFGQQNAQKKTPLEVAQHIGETDAEALIEALLAGRDDGTIGLAAKGEDLELDDGQDDEPMTPSATPREPEEAEPASAVDARASAEAAVSATKAIEVS